MLEPDWEAPKIINLGGGVQNSLSLKELSSWCEDRFGQNKVLASQDERPMDAPWIVMDSTTRSKCYGIGMLKLKLKKFLEEIANHAETNPQWSKVC